jgi:SAM-dependent methyltransferase
LTLGVQETDWSWEQLEIAEAPHSQFSAAPRSAKERATAISLFARLGYQSCEALDVSGFEGAEIIFDLNLANIPSEIEQKYGLVFNGGTLEHVFHLPNALRNLDRLVRPDGLLMHVMPYNNWPDHGFYQFSPTLIFDYYAANGGAVIEAALAWIDQNDADRWYVQPLSEHGVVGQLPKSTQCGRSLFCALIRAAQPSRQQASPTQRYYSRSPAFHKPRWFAPYALVRGNRPWLRQYETVRLTSFNRGEGQAWTVAVPELRSLADTPDDPARSEMILLENDYALGPAHATHAHIGSAGRGAYSHWGDYIWLSTSDGSDPNSNGRTYTLIVFRGNACGEK